MFSHVMLGCSDRERSKKFYDATLGVIGIGPGQGLRQVRLVDDEARRVGRRSADRREAVQHRQWLDHRLRAPSPEAVDAWHAAGVANGGTAIEDPPGIRDAGFGKMYLAYLRDPDGNKLCGFYRIPADQ